jgi:hypothetical protein
VRTAAWSYDDLRIRADEFLRQHHPTGTVPVPIEPIVEFGFGINIIPLPGLHRDHDIDGFISSNLTEIFVDLFVFESRPTRYRFTLAHELAHLVLHGDALKEVRPRSVAEWRRFVSGLSEKDRGWLEWQAYCFAGLILVPPTPLATEYRAALRRADEEGIDITAHGGMARQYIATHIGRLFEVSATVVEKRLIYDGIWERPS